MKSGAKCNFLYTVLCSFKLETMGFYINEEIETKLHWKDVALINMSINDHIERYGYKVDDEQKERMLRLTSRLYQEMYDNPENDKPNSH